ncbi:MAG: hypothetical protein ACP5M9_00355 [Candidatus Micrarchaeia archaeon]
MLFLKFFVVSRFNGASLVFSPKAKPTLYEETPMPVAMSGLATYGFLIASPTPPGIAERTLDRANDPRATSPEACGEVRSA